ncbi:MAG: translation initiation factor 2 [Lachnospiraceae bacterium]|nr:translation initiation factor 2 [Lachnospiraceae bacterium]
MKGEYLFRVRGKRIRFSFKIRRNITVIQGNSATGKTTLLSMMYEYLRAGRESGYSVQAGTDYFVYLRDEVGRDWTDVLFPLHDTIIFIEENNNFIFSQEFAEFVKDSGNYFVLVTRAPLKMLPYSVHEIYEIVADGQHADLKESWHTLRELYSNFPIPDSNHMETVLTEDTNSGFEFFQNIFSQSVVKSAEGNGNIAKAITETKSGDLLVVADGAAFGAMMENCMGVLKDTRSQRISLWLPESFEYLILQSGIVSAPNLDDILRSPADYIDSRTFISWERYFTELLITLTKDTLYSYSKQTLAKYYLTEQNKKKMIACFPEAIREKLSQPTQ